MATCIFCDSQFADPILPIDRQKIFELFDVTFSGKKQLHDSKMCTRCQVQVNLLENASRLRREMAQCLKDKLAVVDSVPLPLANGSPPLVFKTEPVSREGMASLSMAPVIEFPVDLSPPSTIVSSPKVETVQHSPVMQPVVDPRSVYACGHCGQGFVSHELLSAHDLVCGTTPQHCNRCGQILKFMSPETKEKHMMQCTGQGLRRGRPSTGIFNCPKCGLSLKNRMNQDRLKHVSRCTGSGLKRGRPSMKGQVKFQCNKCNKTLYTKEQHTEHVAKCDGSHVERRGRKPGDNHCMVRFGTRCDYEKVCGENMVYRHILKKHLRQVHGIHPQGLDKSFKADDPQLQQIQHQLAYNMPLPEIAGYRGTSPSDLPSEQTVTHRKKGRPQKFVADDLFICATCNKRFEHKSLYDQHCCFRMGDSTEVVLGDAGSEQMSDSNDATSTASEQRSSRASPPIPGSAMPGSAVPGSAVPGSAIAQVISDLLDANKTNAAAQKLDTQALMTGQA